jgi:hypothetical protein
MLKNKEYENEVIISEEAYELIKGLLVKNPKERLGGNVEDLKRMKFFEGIFEFKEDIDFQTVRKKKFLFTPKLSSQDKVIYFDKSRVNDLAFKPLMEIEFPKEREIRTEEILFHNNFLVDDENQPIKREDLLHKKNLECIFSRIKKKKTELVVDFICSLDNTISELNGGEI